MSQIKRVEKENEMAINVFGYENKAIVPYKNDRAIRIEMPIEGRNDILKFTNLYKKMKVPFVIYADFEAIIKKIDDRSKTNTKKLAELVVCGYSYVVVVTANLNLQGYTGEKMLTNVSSMR